MKSNAFARRVNAARTGPVADALCAGLVTDHAPGSQMCRECGSETLLFFDPQTARAEPVCLDCAPGSPSDAPTTNGPNGGKMTTDQITRYARTYADEHFPSWTEIAIRIRLSELSCDGERGELLLLLTKLD